MTDATLKDVAQAAGVDFATASRAINIRRNNAHKSVISVREAVIN